MFNHTHSNEIVRGIWLGNDTFFQNVLIECALSQDTQNKYLTQIEKKIRITLIKESNRKFSIYWDVWHPLFSVDQVTSFTRNRSVISVTIFLGRAIVGFVGYNYRTNSNVLRSILICHKPNIFRVRKQLLTITLNLYSKVFDCFQVCFGCYFFSSWELWSKQIFGCSIVLLES